MPAQIFGTDAVVTILNRAFTDTSPANSTFKNQVSTAGTTRASQEAFAQQFGTGYQSQTNAQLSNLLLKNLGVLPNAGLEAALTDYIAAAGKNNIGLIALQLGEILSNLEADTNGFAAAAVAWNNEVTAAYNYSSNPANQTPSGSGGSGVNLVLTTGVDIINGTGADDTIIADQTGASAQLSAADQINGGAGNDTLKVFLKSTDTATGQPSTLTSIETVALNGGVVTAYTAAAGTTGLTVEAPVLTGGALAAATYTVSGQAVTLKDAKVTANSTTVIASTADTAANLTLNGWTASGAGITNTVDLSGTKVATVNVASTGNTNKVVLTNTGTAVTTLNISGDKAISIAESLNGLKTISAAAATGAVTIDATGATLNAGFAFTGGSANDTLSLKAGALALLTAGSQLDGGAGTGDAVVTNEVAVLDAGQAAKINATKGFEVLGFGVTGSGADVSTITGISTFKVNAGNLSEAFTNASSTSKFIVDTSANNTGTVSIANKVGETSTAVTLDSTGATTATVTLNALTLTGITNVALTSAGTAGNIVTTLNNADNSAITITGAADLTLTTKATAIGSKVDGSAATGKLTLTGNNAAFSAGSSLGDTLIGGTAADTLKASINNATLTGGAGNDKFDVSVAIGGTTSQTLITDFTKGDSIILGAGAGTEVFTKTKVDVSAATTLAAALDLAAAGTGAVNGIVKWFVFGDNTYVVADNTAGATFAVTDQAVKLTGVLDLSTSTFDAAANTLTFA